MFRKVAAAFTTALIITLSVAPVAQARVYLYADPHFMAPFPKPYTTSQPAFPSGWNDVLSSVKNTQNMDAAFYEDINYEGGCFTQKAMTEQQELPFWDNDNRSSMAMGRAC